MFETKQVSDSAKAFAEPFRNTFKTIKEVWDKYGSGVVEGAKVSLKGLGDVASFVDDAFNDLFSDEHSTGAQVLASSLELIKSSLVFIGIVLETIVLPFLKGVWDNLKPLIDLLGGALATALTSIANFLDTLTGKMTENTAETDIFWQRVGQVAGVLLDIIIIIGLVS